jgi:hypothetical protein
MIVAHSSKLVYGATLFTAPGMKGGTHLPEYVSLAIVAVLILLPLVLHRGGGSKPGPPNSDSDDGWGKGPEPPPIPNDPPTGGIPLDDTVQSRVRLRGKGRLSDFRPQRVRRPAREPERTPDRETTFYRA